MTQNKKYRSIQWTPTIKQLDAYYGIKTEKIRSYLKEVDLESLQHKYEDQSINDDFVEYQPLPRSYIDSFDDSNKEKMLQKIADRNGF